ncbi:uncharacterized protein K441DRAFT_705207 [Cenococcum geophilum 1.58]|uniref:uncharacterized protein n=1 Tax=Cenococcum geophilum 1.58 TaxID=794803 RepID=UPI00358F7577|nr:hypothetical protein K441DRAFT_705207 [Cenococcum geophilum 1.58]
MELDSEIKDRSRESPSPEVGIDGRDRSASTTRPTLILYSHGRTPPLNPPPDLKYDLRSIPNPPKNARDAHDGRSKRLREHLLGELKFVQKLDEVESEILEAMEAKIVETAEKLENDQDRRDDGEESRENGEEEGYESLEDEYDPTEAVLRVGCNCALGHHRSVAFVEELARRKWPRNWSVQLIHRDIDRRRGNDKKVRGKSLRWGGA